MAASPANYCILAITQGVKSMKIFILKRHLAVVSFCAFLPQLAHTADHSVDIVLLEVSRPAVMDMFSVPGTRITLDVTIEGKTVLGLGGDSAITTLRDNTGHDLLAEGKSKEAAVLAELTESMGDMFSGGTMTEKNTAGSIDHERAINMVDSDRNSLAVPVITLGLPTKGSTTLHLKGELAIEVAAPGERRVRVDGVTASEDWNVIEVEVDGRPTSCSPSDYLNLDEGTITLYFCDSPKLSRVEVVGQALTVPPGDYGQANLFVMGATQNLSLVFVFPEQEIVRIPVDIEFGAGM